MRRVIVSVISCLCAVPPGVGAEPGCDLRLVGTWKPATLASADEYAGFRYRFDPDGTVAVLSRERPAREIARARYALEEPDAPRAIVFTATEDAGGLRKGTTRMGITAYDEVSFTCARPGAAPARWVRDDDHRHFIVLAARTGTFYDGSGPAFPMLIRTDGHDLQIDAVGTYAVGSARRFGTVPPASYRELLKEPTGPDGVMLRVEIAASQYQRALEILETWKRRAEEGALLYAQRSHLNNVLLTKAVAESLNRCGEQVDLYPLNWVYEDDALSATYAPKDIPFQYFRELKRRNASRHVGDEAFENVAGLIP
jgi:hypothetical protein